MMTTLKALLLGATVAALPITASALTTFGTGETTGGGANDVSNSGAGFSGSVAFSWDTVRYSAFQDFTVDQDFDLFFDAYSPSGAGNFRSGFVLINLTTNTLLTSSRTICANSFVQEEIRGLCDSISFDIASDDHTVDGGTPMFSGLTAGDYRIGLYESAIPDNGTAVFSIAPSAVPLPAGGLLLITALGGIALRRRTAA